MILEIEQDTIGDGIPVIRLIGEIDLHTCGGFRDKLRELIDQKQYDIVIDLAQVPYLDSAALGVLVDSVRRVHEHGGDIYLVATTPFVRRAFEITRLVKIFQLSDTLSDAQNAIEAKRATEASSAPAVAR